MVVRKIPKKKGRKKSPTKNRLSAAVSLDNSEKHVQSTSIQGLKSGKIGKNKTIKSKSVKKSKKKRRKEEFTNADHDVINDTSHDNDTMNDMCDMLRNTSDSDHSYTDDM